MFDKKTVNKIVKDTIEAIQCTKDKSRSDEHLVLITFLMETGMIGMYHDELPIRHGLMAMDFNAFKAFVMNKLRLNAPIMEDIKNISLVDIETDNIDDMFDALMYNVAFQVLIVWAFYRINVSEMPRDISSVASAYCSLWDTQQTEEDDAIESLIEWLNGDE